MPFDRPVAKTLAASFKFICQAPTTYLELETIFNKEKCLVVIYIAYEAFYPVLLCSNSITSWS